MSGELRGKNVFNDAIHGGIASFTRVTGSDKNRLDERRRDVTRTCRDAHMWALTRPRGHSPLASPRLASPRLIHYHIF